MTVAGGGGVTVAGRCGSHQASLSKATAPSTRVGLMPLPVKGPSARCATMTASPIGSGARAETAAPPTSLGSGLAAHTATLKMTKISSTLRREEAVAQEHGGSR